MHNSSAKSKKGFKSIVSLLLVAAILITGALAYLTATDSKENKFTVGNVSIELTEPNWNEENGKNIVPGETIAKDPQIENTGLNDAYVYIMVTVPKKDQITVNENGTEVVKDNLQLFTYDVNENWTLIESKSDDANENNYYVYAYNTNLAPQGNTEPLFEEVTFANIVSSQIESTEELKILVNGYAIQSNNVYDAEGNPATAEEAWDIYANQNGWDWPYEEPAGQSTLTFLDENDVIVHSVTAEEGTPVNMYFDNSLAKTGYSFDWVNETTGEVAYSGMPMPEQSANLAATYALVGDPNATYEDPDFCFVFSGDKDLNGNDSLCFINFGGSAAWDGSIEQLTLPAHVVVDVKDGVGTAQNPLHNISGASFKDYEDGTYTLPVTRLYAGSFITTSFGTVIVPDSVEIIDGQAFEASYIKSIRISYGVKEIGDHAFWDATLETIAIPNSVTSIGVDAFYGCTNLKNIGLPPNVVNIDVQTFANCTSLKSATIAGATVVPEYCFQDCTGLTTVNMNSITGIDAYAFTGCTSLKSITLPTTITNLDENAFNGQVVTDGIINEDNSTTGITDIYYRGTEEQWNAIPGSEHVRSDITVHFAS